MSNAEEILAIADEISPFAPGIASRLRALAARVGSCERSLDEIAENGRLSARLAETVAVEHLSLYRRRKG